MMKKNEPINKADRLAEALRANLRRRKERGAAAQVAVTDLGNNQEPNSGSGSSSSSVSNCAKPVD